ncbi:hypothetical protein I5G86_gp10 [Mycobacterium phage DarthP]|uniref:Uncharacterized protein n=1 Tax=Mycobacterium phage DarthP TaxID=2015879 RepID=A0A286MRG0_9CAUD|nr:hypothetical protein I5G86_gp10 [Mycobacterium phage DarthP]ASW31835.1 hypothetical protein SEA_DARTHP_89 [Mycobacterium phage DarthP]
MFKMIVQMYGRTEVTEHDTLDEVRGRLALIASTQGCLMAGDVEAEGEFVKLKRGSLVEVDPAVTWTYGAWRVEVVDADALVHVVEHGDEREVFLSEAEAKHFQTTIAPGSSRCAERRYPEAVEPAAAPAAPRTFPTGSAVSRALKRDAGIITTPITRAGYHVRNGVKGTTAPSISVSLSDLPDARSDVRDALALAEHLRERGWLVELADGSSILYVQAIGKRRAAA